MSGDAAANLLRERAEAYAVDAYALRKDGKTDDAAFMESMRDELRLVASQVEASYMREMHNRRSR